MSVTVLTPCVPNITTLPSIIRCAMKPMPKSRPSSLQNLAPRNEPHTQKSEMRDVSVSHSQIPPRSRFGCWTCRNRKVKCDEARPQCTPCVRLGHTCDYNPRLSFKDDTPRVIKKISGRGGGVGPVWKPIASGPAQHKRRRLDEGRVQQHSGYSQLSSSESVDTLPPFNILANDEERERKAQYHPPGTFNVVANPTSFINFTEYKEAFPDDPYPPVVSTYGGPPANQADFASHRVRQGSPLHSYNSYESSEDVGDPDIVILKVFEDTDADLNPVTGYRQARSSRSNTISNTTASISASTSAGFHVGLSAQRGDIFNYSVDNTPLLRYAHPDGRDHSIIYYYKNFVHRHLAQVHRDTLGTSVETGALTAPDVMERQAGTFLPVSTYSSEYFTTGLLTLPSFTML